MTDDDVGPSSYVSTSSCLAIGDEVLATPSREKWADTKYDDVCSSTCVGMSDTNIEWVNSSIASSSAESSYSSGARDKPAGSAEEVPYARVLVEAWMQDRAQTFDAETMHPWHKPVGGLVGEPSSWPDVENVQWHSHMVLTKAVQQETLTAAAMAAMRAVQEQQMLSSVEWEVQQQTLSSMVAAEARRVQPQTLPSVTIAEARAVLQQMLSSTAAAKARAVQQQQMLSSMVAAKARAVQQELSSMVAEVMAVQQYLAAAGTRAVEQPQMLSSMVSAEARVAKQRLMEEARVAKQIQTLSSLATAQRMKERAMKRR
eukprot:TRINITY_DN14129_c0_g1_i1.p1 TRINITY_DN14129_c0_g1~~TRINITY_DN14129_c0_g1_i1.p1  ORF type:complete len:315 (-),score=70.25 TRINITY_DN14129_c0_g1_i1:153-1097(-)